MIFFCSLRIDLDIILTYCPREEVIKYNQNLNYESSHIFKFPKGHFNDNFGGVNTKFNESVFSPNKRV